MDSNQLLSATVEMGLDLLEQQGSFLPFCKAVNASGETLVYCVGSDTVKVANDLLTSETVKVSVLRDLEPRELIGAAFCHHTRIRFNDSAEKVPAIEVELHFRGQPAAVWYFPYKMEGNSAQVIEYYSNASQENLFADVET